MSQISLNFIRLKKRPPEKNPPPNNEVDIYFDPTTGNLVRQSADGTETEVSGVSGVSSFGATLIDDADAATARTTLGLGTAATLSTSTGGNGNDDSGLVVTFDGSGQLTCTSALRIRNAGDTATATFAFLDTTSRNYGLPIASGTLALTTQADGKILDTDVTPVSGLVSALPAAGTAGRRRFVTDANATTFGAVVAGGGANGVPVYDDGTNWRIG